MKEKIIFLGITLVMLIVIIGSSYAFLSSQSESSKNHIVKAGKLEINFTSDDSKINLENAYPIPDSEGMRGTPHTFTITNTGSLPASYQISLSDNTSLYNSHNDTGKIFNENQLKLGITNGNGNTTYQMYKKGAFIEGTLDAGKSATYTIRLWIPEHIGNEVQGYHFHGNIKVESVQTLGTRNQNIMKIYAYDEEKGSTTFCVTGEEATCKEITDTPATYETGTIIKYKVNDILEFYFYVVSDNGNTLTLQQRENILYDIPWYTETKDNTKDPSNILLAMENATKEWTNVLNQEYTMGTTIFKDNAYTGCSYNSNSRTYSCTINTYTLEKRIAKARMITLQEAYSLGCLGSVKSCPIWMYNYLTNVTDYGATVNSDINNYGYWTVNTDSSNSTKVWFINCVGNIGGASTSVTNLGARAVVVIQK